jgi:NNP family nitrate/nitrite transporter-like MFS transporter
VPISSLAGLCLLTAIFYLNFFARIVFAPLLPRMEESLVLSHGEAGSFFLFLSCGYFVSLLGSSFLAARVSHQQIIGWSMLTISGSLLLIAAGNSLSFLRGAFFLLGLTSGLYLPSAVATISALYASHQWGRVFAVHELAPNLAFLSAPLAASLMLAYLDWQQSILLLAVLCFCAGSAYLRLGRGRDLHGKPPDLATWLQILRQGDFRFLVLLYTMGIAGTLGVFSILPLYLVTDHLMPLQEANALVGLSRIGTLFTTLLGGWLADRFGNRRTMAAVLFFSGVATSCLGIAHGPALFALIILQTSIAVCFFPAAFSVLAGFTAPETRNVVISLTVPFAFLGGGGLLPYLIATLAETGSFRTGLICAGLFITTGSLLLPLLKAASKPAAAGKSE